MLIIALLTTLHATASHALDDISPSSRHGHSLYMSLFQVSANIIFDHPGVRNLFTRVWSMLCASFSWLCYFATILVSPPIGLYTMVHGFAEHTTVKRILAGYAGSLTTIVPLLTVESNLLQHTVTTVGMASLLSEMLLALDDYSTDQRHRSATNDYCVRIAVSVVALYCTSDVRIVVGQQVLWPSAVCLIHTMLLSCYFAARRNSTVKSEANSLSQASPKTNIMPRAYYMAMQCLTAYFLIVVVCNLTLALWTFFDAHGVFRGMIIFFQTLIPTETGKVYSGRRVLPAISNGDL